MDDLKIEAFGEKGIRFTRSFRASRAMVFEAWTTPKYLQKWLLGPGDNWTMPVCEVDLRVGGGYRFQWKDSKTGNVMGMRGEYMEIDPPARLVTTEKFDEAWYPGEASIVMELVEENGVTTVTQVIEYDSAATRDGVMRSPMESGVRVSYNRLAGMLE